MYTGLSRKWFQGCSKKRDKKTGEKITGFRSGWKTIQEQERDKLLKSTSQYKDRVNDTSDDTVVIYKLKVKVKETDSEVIRGSLIKNKVHFNEVDGKSKLKSKIFAPHTEKSERVKRW